MERKFATLIGKTPKQYSKLVRFQAVIRELSKNQVIDWAQLAYAYGYADQSHLIKDFKSISGLTPVSYQTLCCKQFSATDFTF
jgi:methylphosphotriester-DNA--protein-cysteine methyltransferase